MRRLARPAVVDNKDHVEELAGPMGKQEGQKKQPRLRTRVENAWPIHRYETYGVSHWGARRSQSIEKSGSASVRHYQKSSHLNAAREESAGSEVHADKYQREPRPMTEPRFS